MYIYNLYLTHTCSVIVSLANVVYSSCFIVIKAWYYPWNFFFNYFSAKLFQLIQNFSSVSNLWNQPLGLLFIVSGSGSYYVFSLKRMWNMFILNLFFVIKFLCSVALSIVAETAFLLYCKDFLSYWLKQGSIS